MQTEPIRVGAIVSEPRVIVVWDMLREHFDQAGFPVYNVFFSQYEQLLTALVSGEVELAWGSSLAWLEAQRRSGNCRAVAMRDTDRDRLSHFIVRSDAGLGGLSDLSGKTLAVGAKDSPHATLLPLQALRRQGLQPERDFRLRRFDHLVGKHGEHPGGERAALASLRQGQVDAACVLDLNWLSWSAAGTVDPSRLSVLASTPPFDRAAFLALDGLSPAREAQFLEPLLELRWELPRHRELMDLVGAKEWLPGRTSGFELLDEAVREQDYFDTSV
jgi:phosphonate transport system substrate-binding protein